MKKIILLFIIIAFAPLMSFGADNTNNNPNTVTLQLDNKKQIGEELQKKGISVEKNSISYNRASAEDEGISEAVEMLPESEFGVKNDKVKIQNVYTDNLSTNPERTDTVMTIKPFKDDVMDIDFGAGKAFSNDNHPSRSQINLSTKVKL